MAISGWFGQKDPEVWRKYNAVLAIRLAKNISKKLEEFDTLSGTVKSDVVGSNYYYRHKYVLLENMRKELDSSKVFSWKVSEKNVPIKQLYVTIYDAIYNKKRSSGYSYFKTLERFVLDGKGNGQGELPAVEHELANEMVAYRDQVLNDLRLLRKEDVERINKQYDITKALASKSPKDRRFLIFLIVGVITLGIMMISVAEDKDETGTVHTENSSH